MNRDPSIASTYAAMEQMRAPNPPGNQIHIHAATIQVEPTRSNGDYHGKSCYRCKKPGHYESYCPYLEFDEVTMFPKYIGDARVSERDDLRAKLRLGTAEYIPNYLQGRVVPKELGPTIKNLIEQGLAPEDETWIARNLPNGRRLLAERDRVQEQLEDATEEDLRWIVPALGNPELAARFTQIAEQPETAARVTQARSESEASSTSRVLFPAVQEMDEAELLEYLRPLQRRHSMMKGAREAQEEREAAARIAEDLARQASQEEKRHEEKMRKLREKVSEARKKEQASEAMRKRCREEIQLE
jgi:rubrerythrin